jgi:hypothetical protein
MSLQRSIPGNLPDPCHDAASELALTLALFAPTAHAAATCRKQPPHPQYPCGFASLTFTLAAIVLIRTPGCTYFWEKYYISDWDKVHYDLE